METEFQNLLVRTIVALPFGIGGIGLLIMGLRRFDRFFMMDYLGNLKERFTDNLLGNLFVGLGGGCLVSAFMVFQGEEYNWGLLSIPLCFGAFIIPIGIVGAYWRSYVTNKIWGGFVPMAREAAGYAPPGAINQYNIDSSKLKLPPRTIVTALLIAILVFFGTYSVLHTVQWNASALSGLIFRLFASGLLALGTFVTITTASLSRRIQKMKDGEPLDDDAKM